MLAFGALTLAVRQGIGAVAVLSAIARLSLVLALVNVVVTLLVNPWRDNRPSDRFPGIVQDFAVLALLVAIGGPRFDGHDFLWEHAFSHAYEFTMAVLRT